MGDKYTDVVFVIVTLAIVVMFFIMSFKFMSEGHKFEGLILFGLAWIIYLLGVIAEDLGGHNA